MMDGDEVKVAFAVHGYDVHRIAKIFGVDKRSIWRWQIEGAPPHISLAIERWLQGELSDRGVKPFLKRIGRTRRDADRYKPKS